MSTTSETHVFQAEVQRVLHLVIHSLYSNKEIFLRELVSNASDALDKLRFAAITEPELLSGDSEYRIEIETDETARTLTIRDNGIGMDREALISNLGTIARSGTKQFLDNLNPEQKQDANLIGQFGVGFYSGFIVAKQLDVTSKAAGAEQAYRWSSDGSGQFTVDAAEDGARGTEIVLHLKEGEDEFLKAWRFESLINKYSDHIAFPIKVKKPAERAEADETDEDESETPAAVVSEATWQTVNQASALWTRPKSELSDSDYQNFYHHISHDAGDALAWAHNKVEGNQSYVSLLYVPTKPPFDLMMGNRDERKGLKLYVKRVFIMDAAEQLLPAYLRFVRGVVDSDNLPLNVSRELLQDSKLSSAIRASCIKRVLDLLDKLSADEPAKFADFWGHFGAVLKEGLSEDFANRERIAKLLRFASTTSEGNVSFDEYIARMRPGQDAIYYITAESLLAAKNSPHLEALKRKGVEVLLMHERVDEWVMSYLNDYTGKPVKSVAKGQVELDKIADIEGAEQLAQVALEPALAERLSKVLSDKVREVRGSTRLAESAACLVVDAYDMALHMQRVLKQAGQPAGGGKPALEINAGHPLVQRMAATEDEARFAELATLLYEQAVLSEGGQLDDPSGFVKRLNGLLLAA